MAKSKASGCFISNKEAAMKESGGMTKCMALANCTTTEINQPTKDIGTRENSMAMAKSITMNLYS